jgi:hypothetical protein
LEVADSGSRTPPTDLVAGTIFSTSTLSRRGMRRFAIAWVRACARLLRASVLKKKKKKKKKKKRNEKELHREERIWSFRV